MSNNSKIPWLILRDKILFAGWAFCSALIIIGAYLITNFSYNHISPAYDLTLTMRGYNLAVDDAGVCVKNWRLVLDHKPNPTCCHYPFCVIKDDVGDWYLLK